MDMEGKELALQLKKAWQGLGDLKVTQGRGKGLGVLFFFSIRAMHGWEALESLHFLRL